ncbi:hypothetical protein F4604DRAFT_937857 [Suillus subluteus]|nr:hypothetical protein F4604DRAFT_937857 [Suillus subluteus]
MERPSFMAFYWPFIAAGCLRKSSSHHFWLVGKDSPSSLERLFIVLDIVFLRFYRCFGILVCHSGTPELVLIQEIRAQNRGQSILAIWGAEMISVSDQFHTWSHRVTPSLPRIHYVETSIPNIEAYHQSRDKMFSIPAHTAAAATEAMMHKWP